MELADIESREGERQKVPLCHLTIVTLAVLMQGSLDRRAEIYALKVGELYAV